MALSLCKLISIGILALALSVPTTLTTPVSSVFDFLLKNNTTTNLTSATIVKRHDEISVSNGGRDYGDQCDTINPCNYAKFLECIDGKCMCLNPLHRAYDEDLKVCVSLAGSGCGGNGPQCVRNSKCSYGACQCIQNYGQTTTKVCLLGRGNQCEPNECNGDKNLACIQGTCQCIDSLMVYQPFSGRCLDAQQEFGDYVRNIAQRVVVGKISGTVLGAKSLARGIVFLPVRLLIPGLG